MKMNNRPELKQSTTIEEIPLACADETAAVEFIEKQRWGKEPVCPHCEGKDVYKMLGRDGKRNARYLWRCRGCAEQFTVRIGTVYEDSRLPLKHWCYAFWRASTSKKGVSALEISRQCQITYKSALFLMHRIRFAMQEDVKPGQQLAGECEIDSTFIGGKPRPAHLGLSKNKPSVKTQVVALVQRDGQVRTEVMPSITHKNIRRFIDQNVARSATMNSDQAPVYREMFFDWALFGRHHIVNHGKLEYIRKNPDGTVAGVNNCESFFALLKRGLHGTFHAVSKKHLHRYCAEFQFRWNARKMDDGQRTALAIQSAQGKRLIYKEPTK